MKKLSILLSFPLLLLFSCKDKNTYTVEIFYSDSKGNGDTTMVTEKDNISADSDSIAYIKAQDKFKALLGKPGDKHGMPVKFSVRNHDGVIITQPGQDSTQEMEKQMYPAQKPAQ